MSHDRRGCRQVDADGPSLWHEVVYRFVEQVASGHVHRSAGRRRVGQLGDEHQSKRVARARAVSPEQVRQGLVVVLGQTPVEHHLTGQLRIPPSGNELLVKVSHQRFDLGWRRDRSEGARGSVGHVVVVDADHLPLFLSGRPGEPLSELVLLVGAVLDPVAGGSAVFALDEGAVLNVVAEHVALEAANSFIGIRAVGEDVAGLVADAARKVRAVLDVVVAVALRTSESSLRLLLNVC